MNASHNLIKQKTLSFIPILKNHLKNYPLMTAQDIYKLVYQAAMGPGHLIADKENGLKSLNLEFENVEPKNNQPLVEEIDPAGIIVRIYLNSSKFNRNKINNLFEAFYQTMTTFQSSVTMLEKYLDYIHKAIDENNISIDKNDLIQFSKLNRKNKFSATRHSDIYRKTYQPAYRLILKKYLDFI